MAKKDLEHGRSSPTALPHGQCSTMENRAAEPKILSARHFLKSASVIAVVGIVVLPTPAVAQQTGELEEVVVTATKRETLAQDTPISMTVIGSDALRSTHADDFADFASLVPGLTATDTGPGAKRHAL